VTYGIESIDITGFRAFSRRQSVRFFKNLTVILGQNGSGKSSLIDAVSWLFNADLPRYVSYGKDWENARRVHTRCLFDPGVESMVSALFYEVGGETTAAAARTEQAFQADSSIGPWFEQIVDDRLHRHLLGQSTMLAMVQGDAMSRFRVIAPMLKLDSLVSDIDRRQEARRQAAKALHENRQGLAAHPEVGDWTKHIDALSDGICQLVSAAGIPAIKPASTDWRLVRDWYQDLGRAISASEGRCITALASLRSRYGRSQGTTQDSIVQAESRATEASSALETARRDLAMCHDGENLARSGLAESARILLESSSCDGRLAAHIEQQQLLNQQIASSDLKQNIEDHQARVQRLSDLIVQLSKAEQLLGVGRIRSVEIVQRLRDVASSMKRLLDEQTEIREWLLANGYSDTDDRDSLVSTERDLKAAEPLSRHGDLYWELLHSREILAKILPDVECPLCGARHESIEALKVAIERRGEVLARETDRLTLRVGSLHVQAEELTNRIRSRASRLAREKQLRDEIAAEERESISLSGELKRLCTDSTPVGSALGSSKWGELEQVVQEDFDLRLQSIRAELSRHEAERETTREQLEKSKQELVSFTIRLDEESHLIEKVRADQDALLTSARSVGKRFDFELDSLAELPQLALKLNEVQSKYVRRSSELAEAERHATEEDVSAHLAWANALDVHISGLAHARSALAELSNLLEGARAQEDRRLHRDAAKKAEREHERADAAVHAAERALKVAIAREMDQMRSLPFVFQYLCSPSVWTSVTADLDYSDRRRRSPKLTYRPVPRLAGCEETSADAAFTFSSGEMAVLALSVFLSLSSGHAPQTIGDGPAFLPLILDDPVLYTDAFRDDAINRLLADAALSRQVLLATSDHGFANRLLLASRPLWEKKPDACGLLHFASLNRDGPTIESTTAADWLLSSGVYLGRTG
jgi:energy-coupling factor transporter ATP-binding protein EcfA2